MSRPESTATQTSPPAAPLKKKKARARFNPDCGMVRRTRRLSWSELLMVTSNANIISTKVGYVHTNIRSASPVCATQPKLNNPPSSQMAVR